MWDCGCAFCPNACVLVLGGGGALGESMDLLSSLPVGHAGPTVEYYFLLLHHWLVLYRFKIRFLFQHFLLCVNFWLLGVKYELTQPDFY